MLTSASHADGEGRALAAGANADERASVYVLKMGQPVRIYDLAERMIRLAGFEPGEDIDIVVTGTRPGERLHEILFAREEPMAEIGIDGVMAAKARLRRPGAARPLARGARPGGRRRRPRGGRAGLRGGDSGVQAPVGGVDRASRASASCVDTVGCHPKRLSAAGLATREPARRSNCSSRPASRAAAARSDGGHRDQARAAPEPAAQRGDHVRRPSRGSGRRR